MTNHARLAAAALAVLAAAGVAGCKSTASSAAAAPASPAVAAKAAATSAPPAVAAVSPLAACKSLAAWENSDSSETLGRNTALQATFAASTDSQLSGDFATWVSDIKTGSSGTIAAGSRVASDCAAWDVTIFPPVTPPPAAPATTAPPPAPQTVTFKVTGSYAQVTYGPAGSNTSGTVPMKVTDKLGSPIYYALTAQLQGSGTVTCEIAVDGKVISKATASGGYNIAQCEISPDPFTGGWEDTNQG
jgi:hypothetical protein